MRLRSTGELLGRYEIDTAPDHAQFYFAADPEWRHGDGENFLVQEQTWYMLQWSPGDRCLYAGTRECLRSPEIRGV